MAKVNAAFKHDIYRFIHKPIRESDKKFARLFLERFVFGMQRQFENAHAKIDLLPELWDPAKTPQPRYLKDIVGFTAELDNITNDISDADLRRLIRLAVPLWKEKGLEVGYRNIIRLFTGKNSRTFNWFDFRLIVGEAILGQDELGTDMWAISTPNVTATNPSGNVVLLLTFEGNTFDRSINDNQTEFHGSGSFFQQGPVTGSEQYLRLFGAGALRVFCSSIFDFSNDLTIELFFRTNIAQNRVLYSKTDGSKVIEIRLRSDTNQIIYTLNDGSSVFTETLAAVSDIDDNTWRHLALIIDRTNNTSRLYFNSNEATAGLDISTMGDLTIVADQFVGASGISVDRYAGDLDNVRISLSAQYDLTQGFIPVPSATFIEYRQEELDEFYTDIRVVDNGDLNRVLVKRILNLMRPPSERIRTIFIQFFESFEFGKGELRTVTGSASVNTTTEVLQLPALSVEEADVTGASDFQDIVLQVKVKITSGSTFAVRFHIQDTQNYFLATMDVANDEFKVFKVVAGVSTQLGVTNTSNIVLNTFYVLSIITDFNDLLGNTMIKVLLDSSVVNQVVDDTFDKGSWAVETLSGTTAEVDQIEMFTMPLETDYIQPNEVI